MLVATAVGRNLYWIEVSEDGTTAFVSLAGEGKVAAVDLATLSVRTVDVGPKPKRLENGDRPHPVRRFSFDFSRDTLSVASGTMGGGRPWAYPESGARECPPAAR